MSVYITGDTHGQIDRIYDFCLLKHNLSHKDILIIAGDVGLNFWLNNTEKNKKAKLAKLPITIICIQGNHEKRPEAGLLNYRQIHIDNNLLQGDYWFEPEYPNILFAINGEHKIYGKSFLIADGAYSIDRFYRQSQGIPWFEDEQMSDEDMNRLFQLCGKKDYFDFVITHAAPMNYEPRYLFLDFVEQTMVDKHTEWILQEIMDKIQFGHWIFGHYHADNWDYYKNPRMSIIYQEIKEII